MINQPVPAVTLKTRVRDEAVEGPNPFRWQDVDTGELFGEGRHILFGLPGAYTPDLLERAVPGLRASPCRLRRRGRRRHPLHQRQRRLCDV